MRELVAAIGCSAILVPAARAGTIRAACYLRQAKHGLGRSKPDRGAVPPASAGECCG
jgi:hypothetical protein